MIYTQYQVAVLSVAIVVNSLLMLDPSSYINVHLLQLEL